MTDLSPPAKRFKYGQGAVSRAAWSAPAPVPDVEEVVEGAGAGSPDADLYVPDRDACSTPATPATPPPPPVPYRVVACSLLGLPVEVLGHLWTLLDGGGRVM